MTDLRPEVGGLIRWALLVAALAAGGGHAQEFRCVPNHACLTPITFAPTASEYAASVGGTLTPTSPTQPVQMRVNTPPGQAFVVSASRSPWPGGAAMGLEARYTITPSGQPTRVTDWIALDAAPVTIFSGSQKTDVQVEYRLIPAANTLPGTYVSTVTYTTTGSQPGNGGNGNGRGGQTSTTPISVTIPSFVSLRVAGVVVGQIATVDFDYVANSAAYGRAVFTGTPLTVTSANFQSVDVATDDPNGYTVTITVAQTQAPPGSSLTVGHVLLFGSLMNGRTLSSSGPTAGFVSMVRPTDITIAVDGGELPGTYGFTVTYSAQANP